jgi:uncharacterized protein
MDETGPKVVVYGGDEPELKPVLLNDVEARVLGALVEKQLTTPDYYPLTLNALVNACNQTSSRDPVVSYDESTVMRGLDGLRDQKLASVTTGAESRVPRYRHKLTERFELSPAELATLCILVLRGPQTSGEIRTRSGRLHEFASIADVEATLDVLAARQPEPLVTKLPRQLGLKESRFAHLLSPITARETSAQPISAVAAPPPAVDRTAQLEQQVTELRQQIDELTQQFAEFRKQFE